MTTAAFYIAAYTVGQGKILAQVRQGEPFKIVQKFHRSDLP
jgi:hypothetical protein